jgi:hypothetical protein
VRVGDGWEEAGGWGVKDREKMMSGSHVWVVGMNEMYEGGWMQEK